MLPITKPAKGSSTTGQLIRAADELNEAIQQDKSKPDQVAGVLARVTTDQDHWLTAGVKPEVIGMVTGSQIHTLPINKLK